MTSARDPQIRALYRAALQRPPAERASFLADATGDDAELRRSIELLLSRGDATDAGAHDARAGDAEDLAAGTMLGQYRIEGALGRGGMGVVYRATDTKLNRSVAIKFLSVGVVDGEARRRFRQEAATASSLNHPHVVTVHDVGEHGDRQFIVSELVDGGTLIDWTTTNRRRTWRQSVELLTGVADALAAAHAAGVLHRDVKPGNILIGANGYAKLADFGLAKVVARDAGAKGAPTTQTGVVVGTVAYMSPEQATGQPLDARSDVFSFGIVLYELLAGKQPFEAANDLEVLKAIVHATPLPLPDSVPDLLQVVVDKALEKEPRDRYQTMQDLVADLRRVVRKPGSSQSRSQTSDARVIAGMVKRRRGTFAAIVLAFAVVVAVGTYFVASRLASSGGPAPARIAPRDYEVVQLTTSGDAVTPSISPDGRWIAYRREAAEGGGSISIRQVATMSNVAVVPPQAAFVGVPTVTPDGGYVDFIRREPTSLPGLWRVEFLGGAPRPLVESAMSPVAWSPDGKEMAFVRVHPGTSRSDLVIADAEGGQEHVLATREPPAHFLSTFLGSDARPAWSPDGKTVAVFEQDATGRHLAFVDVETGSTVRPSGGGVSPEGVAWLGPNLLVLSQANGPGQRVQLWRMSYPDGALSLLTNDLNSYIGADVDATRTSLVTARRETRKSIWVSDASGENLTEAVPPQPYGGASAQVVWAGDRVLYDTTVGARTAISALAPDGTTSEVVAGATAAAGTPDGGSLVFVNPEGFWRRDGASRDAVRLLADPVRDPLVTRDGQYAVFLASPNADFLSPWMMSLGGGEATQISAELTVFGSVDVSWDSRRVSFVALRDGRRLVVCEMPACVNRRERDVPPSGNQFRWVPNASDEIAFVDQSGLNIWALPVDGGAARQLTRYTDDGSGRRIAAFAWSGDGNRLAIVRSTTTSDIVLFRGVQ